MFLSSRLLKLLSFMAMSLAAPHLAPAMETAADLSALTLSTGALSPGFHREITAYSSTTPFPQASLTLNGTPATPATASIRTRLNGAPALAGLPQSLGLRPGLNQIDLRIVASGSALTDFPLAAGGTRNLALHPDGRILQWGVAAGDTPPGLPAATQSGVTAVFSGPAGEYYLKSDGALYTLSGSTLPSALTVGSAGVSQPRVVTADIGTIIAVALRADGTIRTWGASLSLQDLGGVVAVAAGYRHVLALGADGRVSAWGIGDSYGELTVPAAAQSGVVAIAAHNYRNLALRADGTLVQWGQVSVAQAAIPAEATDIAAIGLNDNSDFVLTRSGAVIAWGNTASAADTPPAGATADVVALKTGPRHTLALKADGSVIAWGLNGSGQPSLAPSGFDPLVTPPLRDYVVKIDRPIPSPALAALETSGGALSPAFAPDTLAYTQSVPYGTSTLDLSAIPLAADSASVGCRINGASTQLASPTAFPLRTGINQIELRVTAGGRPLAVFPFATNSTRALAVSSSGAVVQCPLSPSGSSLAALPSGTQGGVAGVFSGPYGEYALKTDGTLVRLSGATIPAAAKPVSPATAITALAVGASHALLLRADGTTYAWGSNSYGQTTIPADAQSGVVAVACGPNHSIALRADGRVVAWGQNNTGQASVPPALKSDIAAISACALGNYGSYALTADGRVLPWGWFITVTPPLAAQSGIAALAMGETAAYALTKGGAVVAWYRSTGALLSPPALLQSEVVAIAAGPAHLLALKSDGSVQIWSSSGDNTSFPAVFPSPLVDAPVRTYRLSVERRLPTALSALAPALGTLANAFAPETDSYTLAAATPYRGLALYGLPFINHSRLEIRSGAAAFQPVVPGQSVAYMSQGGAALRADGSVLGWGSYPVPAAAQSEVVALSGSQNHLLALKADGSVVAWGLNAYGQTSLPAGLRAVAIAAGDSCSLLLQPDGSPVVYGGSSALQTPPADAVDLVAIAAGSSHAMGLRRDGCVVAWGSSSSLITTVPADAQSGIVAIAAGGDQCYALRADGRVVSWGSGASGLGTVPAAATYGVVAISGGGSHAVALRADGSVVSWGRSFASLPPGSLPDIAALITGTASFSDAITTAILRDGSLVQLDFASNFSPPSDFSSGRFALPLNSLLPLSPGASTLELRVTSRTGADTRTYSLGAQRSAAPELSLRVASWPYSLPDGGFSVVPASLGLNLGFIKVGPPLVTPWVLANTGSADLVIGSGSFLGANAAEFALSGLSFPLTLGPGEQIAFDTFATPAATGFRYTTLVLSANLPHGAPYTLPLGVEGLTAAGVLAAWRSSRFTSAELGDPALEATVWGNLADPDGDGLPNLLEYALNTAPKTPGLPPAATLDTSAPGAPRLSLTYTRVKRAAAAGIVYRVEWSDSLATDSWSDAGVTEQVIPVTGAFATVLETVVASVAADSPQRFLRLRVTAP